MFSSGRSFLTGLSQTSCVCAGNLIKCKSNGAKQRSHKRSSRTKNETFRFPIWTCWNPVVVIFTATITTIAATFNVTTTSDLVRLQGGLVMPRTLLPLLQRVAIITVQFWRKCPESKVAKMPQKGNHGDLRHLTLLIYVISFRFGHSPSDPMMYGW